MANNNNMLTFGVGFDWSKAVDQKAAQAALDRAQRIVTSQPLVITARYDQGSLKEFEYYYTKSIDTIRQRISDLNTAWSKMDFKDKFDASGHLIDKLQSVNIGTKESPNLIPINPAKAEGEIAQLTAALQTYGKTLSDLHQDRLRAIGEEQRAERELAEAMARYHEDELRGIVEAMNKRIAAYNQEQQQLQRLREERQKSIDQAFAGIKGYSTGAIAEDAAVTKQILRFEKLSEYIEKLTVRYEKYKALQAEAGGKGYEDKINTILENRAVLQEKIKAITTTADEANAKRVAKEAEINKQIEQQTTALQNQIQKQNQLAAERAKQQQAQASLTSTQSALDKATEAYDRQEKKVAVLERAFMRAKAAREKLESSGKAKDAQGLNTDAYEKALKREETASVRYTQATKDLTTALSAKITEEERWFSKSEQETVALKRQKDAVASLNTEITKTQLSRMYISPNETQLEKANRLVKEQQNAVSNLAAEYRKAQSEREKYDGKGTTKAAYDKDGFQTAGYKAALQAELKAGQDLLAAEQKLTERLSQRAQVQQRVAEQAQRDTITIANQKSAVDALADSINRYQAVQAAIGTNESKINKLNKSLQDQDIIVNLLRDDWQTARDARIKFETDGKTKNPDGTANKAYIEALQKEEQLAKQLNQAEQQLLNTQQRRLDLLRQIGLSGNVDKISWGAYDSAAIDAQINRYNQLTSLIRGLGIEYENLKAIHNAAGTDITKDERAKQILKERIEFTKELEQVTKTADQAQAEALRKQEALHARIEASKRRRLKAANDEIRATKLQENSLENIRKKLAALEAVRSRTKFDTAAGKSKYDQYTAEIERLKKKIEELTATEEKANEKAEKARKKAISGLEYQKGVFDRLIQRMAVYASFGALMGFLQKVRDITAEFERQRVALGAIIQDQVKANSLFAEIKSFALKSPIKILDLVKYTKQVAAYRIETDKLWDTTKRLADVSVGLGVDMQRLVLAYGQVKAATYLRASELRQFTEAGIPMLELLSERFTQLEGHMVSTADVMKRITKRGVEFKDVEQVFLEMTSAGGMFYNMQEKLGNTLYGMWAKLGDAAAIMYDQIGNTGWVNDGMKWLISTLTNLMRNWNSWAKSLALTGAVTAVAVLAMKTYTAYLRYVELSTKKNTVADIAARNALIKKSVVLKLVNAGFMKLWKNEARATAATIAFSKAINFIGTGVIMGVVYFVTLLTEKLFEAYENAHKLERELKKIDEESGVEQMKSVRNFERLANATVKAYNEGRNYKDTLDELQRTYKDMIPLEKLSIENLIKLKGNYDSLTMSVKDYVAEQMKRKKVDTIIETTGAEMIRAEQKFKKDMKDIWDEDQLEAFMTTFDEIVKKNAKAAYTYGWTVTNYTEALKNAAQQAAEEIGVSYDEIDQFRSKESEYNKILEHLQDYAVALAKQTKEVEAMESAWTKDYEALGEYGERFEWLKKLVDETDVREVSGIAVTPGDYLYQQQKKNMMVLETIKPMLHTMLSEAHVGWRKEWGYFIDEVNADTPELISAINFDLVFDYLNENISRIPPKAYKAIEGLRKIYDGIAPDDNQTRVIRERLVEIVQEVTGSLDKMPNYTRYFKENNQTIVDWVKSVKEQKNEIDKQIKGLKDTANAAAQLSFAARNVFAMITGGEVVSIEDMEETSKVLEKLLAPFADLLEKGGRGTDPRLSEAQNVVSEIEKMYNKVLELEKSMSRYEAINEIQQKYEGAMAEIEKWAAKAGVSINGMLENEESFLRVLREIKGYMSTLPKSEKVELDIEAKIGEVQFKTLKKDIEDRLKALSDEVAQSKEARDFFDNIFSQTKDYDMSMELTMAVYGDTGENYQQQMIDELRAAFGAGEVWEVDLKPFINLTTAAVDYNELENQLVNIPPIYQAQAKKILDDMRKADAERAKQWMKDLSKARTYAQQRVDLAKYTAERIREIETAPNILDARKKELIGLYLTREAKEAAKLEWEAFKDTPMYVQMFENLENATTSSLTAMNNKLVELQKNLTDLDPAQLKEIQKRMEEIQSQLAERNINPFGWLKKAAKEMKKWQAELESDTKTNGKFALGTGYENGISTMRELEAAVADFTKRQEDANKAVMDFMNGQEYQEAVKAVNDLQARYDAMKPEERDAGSVGLQLEVAKAALALKNEELDKLTNEADKLRKILEYLQGQVGEYNRIRAKQKEAWKGADIIKAEVDKVTDAAYEMAEAFGASDDALALFQDIKAALSEVYDFTKSVTDVIKMMSVAATEEIKSVEKASIILAAISATLKVATAVFNLFANANARKKERAIKEEQKLIDSLTRAYDKLSDAMDKTFGADYIRNYNDRIKNLEAQQAAAVKQAQLEREKGKKADADKVQDYLDNARDAADEIEKMQSEIAETLAGTDVASAARDFASAWLDAYISFESTSQAIKEKFNDMIKNMIVESAMGQIVQAVLQPLYDQIKEAALSNGQLTAEEVVELAGKIPTYTTQITDGLQIFANQLENLGMDIHALGDTGDFTGIAREIASASEESVTGLAAAINTQNYYISNIPLIYQEVALIRQLLSGEASAMYAPAAVSTAELQNEYLSHLPAIRVNTDAIAERCERAASACEDIADKLGKVISYGGASKGYAVVIN